MVNHNRAAIAAVAASSNGKPVDTRPKVMSPSRTPSPPGVKSASTPMVTDMGNIKAVIAGASEKIDFTNNQNA